VYNIKADFTQPRQPKSMVLFLTRYPVSPLTVDSLATKQYPGSCAGLSVVVQCHPSTADTLIAVAADSDMLADNAPCFS